MPSGDTILKRRPIAALVSLLLLGSASVRLLAGPETTKQIDQRLFQELRWRSIGHFRGEWDVQVHGRRKDVEADWIERFAADCKDSCRSARCEPCFCGGARARVWTKPGARRFSFERRRGSLAESAVP